MDELENVENLEEELKDDEKIHFPVGGMFVIGGIVLLMIVCIVVLIILGNK